MNSFMLRWLPKMDAMTKVGSPSKATEAPATCWVLLRPSKILAHKDRLLEGETSKGEPPAIKELRAARRSGNLGLRVAFDFCEATGRNMRSDASVHADGQSLESPLETKRRQAKSIRRLLLLWFSRAANGGRPILIGANSDKSGPSFFGGGTPLWGGAAQTTMERLEMQRQRVNAGREWQWLDVGQRC